MRDRPLRDRSRTSRWLAGVAGALLLGHASVATSGVIIDPVPGTGTVALLSNGGFETGDLTNWPVRIIGTSNAGDWEVSTDLPFNGNHSAKSVPGKAFTGPGFARVHDGIAVTAGVEYVIGAFFYLDNFLLPAVYVDLGDPTAGEIDGGDITFERLFDVTTADAPAFLGANQDRWIFAWESFTPLVDTTVDPRIVMDRNVQTTSLAYIDDVFLIEASSFAVPASRVPAPPTLVVLAIPLLAVGSRRSWRRSRISFERARARA